MFLVLYDGVEYLANPIFATDFEVVDENGNSNLVQFSNFINEYQTNGMYFIEELQIIEEVQFVMFMCYFE